jgi:hypothetical protein
MPLLRRLIRTICVLLVAAFGAVAAFAAPYDLSQVSYPFAAQKWDSQPVNLTYTARAPPTASANVMATGTAFAQAGNLRALDGVETSGAVYALLQCCNAPNTGFVIPPTREIPIWHGSGPRSGVIGLNSQSKSNGALRNFNPSEGVEFVFDPSTSTFLVRAPSSPVKHSILADSIDAPRNQVVGGMLTRGPDGKFLTNEASGHFHQNWTPELRTQFTETMKRYGLEFDHRAGM